MIIMFRTSPSNFLILTGVGAVFIVSVTFWVTCSDFVSISQRRFGGGESPSFTDIDCRINAEYTIACKKLGSEVYIPFSFLAKYFEIYGSMNGDGHFDWNHSHGKINKPRGTYNPRGIFMYFDNYNVEMRDRVKCISAIDGVPVSTQWSQDGYSYATQIAQFGLSHYSKNFTETEPKIRILENADDEEGEWEGEVTRIPCHDRSSSSCVAFSSAITLNLNISSELVLQIDVLFQLNASMIVRVQHKDIIYTIVYAVSDELIQVKGNEIFYGIGRYRRPTWKKLTRDLFIDVQKGVQLNSFEKVKKKIRKNDIRVIDIKFDGSGAFDNLTLATSDHMAQFFDAAEWFVKHQNKTTGGWSIPVKRRLGVGFMELPSGWYSAMSQGHAISLLSRAYYATGNRQYLLSAVNGLKLFKVPSYQGGIMSTFLGKYVWYEEYPTSPSSYVLNGFIYSLFGLYDLNAIAPQNYSNEAGRLFDNGMISLKKLLTLYDTGSGSTYDLRHFSLSVTPNIARWDYHATHVNQLLLLATIDKDQVLIQTAERWKDYMRGVRAQHN